MDSRKKINNKDENEMKQDDFSLSRGAGRTDAVGAIAPIKIWKKVAPVHIDKYPLKGCLLL